MTLGIKTEIGGKEKRTNLLITAPPLPGRVVRPVANILEEELPARLPGLGGFAGDGVRLRRAGGEAEELAGRRRGMRQRGGLGVWPLLVGLLLGKGGEGPVEGREGRRVGGCADRARGEGRGDAGAVGGLLLLRRGSGARGGEGEDWGWHYGEHCEGLSESRRVL